MVLPLRNNDSSKGSMSIMFRPAVWKTVIMMGVTFFLGRQSRSKPSAEVINPTMRRARPTFHSAHGQDKWLLDQLLYDHLDKKMTFVEAGSFDGLTGSNVATFELDFGWDGLCYEPNPFMFQRVQERRKKCRKFNAVICDPSKTRAGKTLTYLELDSPKEQESGILEFMDEYKKEQIKKYAVKSKINLSCRSLSDDIVNYLGGHADVLSLDVEGSELSVLQTVEWTKITIDVIFVEVSHEVAVREYLVNMGYVHVAKVGDDNVFLYKTSKYMKNYKRGCKCLQKGGECTFKLVYPTAGWLNCPEN